MAAESTTTKGHASAEKTGGAGERARTGWASAINQLTKPRITLMVLITAGIGFAAGVRKQSNIDAEQIWISRPDTLKNLIFLLLGTALTCIAAGIFNQVIEKKSDGLMNRTATRPMVTGKISWVSGLVIGFILMGIGLWVLVEYNNVTTAVLSAITIASYALVYTPLKRVTHVSTIIGAFPGAVPPVMGYTAARDAIGDVEAWVLFAILFLWQLPHFLAIAWLYKDDYAKAGLPMLPVVDNDFQATARQILLCCLILVPVTTLPFLAQMAGMVYLLFSSMIAVVVLYTAVKLYFARTRPNARLLFFALLIYLPIVFGLVFLDQK